MSKFFMFFSYGILIFIIFYLFYLLMSGVFCRCQPVKCPSYTIDIYQTYYGRLIYENSKCRFS